MRQLFHYHCGKNLSIWILRLRHVCSFPWMIKYVKRPCPSLSENRMLCILHSGDSCTLTNWTSTHTHTHTRIHTHIQTNTHIHTPTHTFLLRYLTTLNILLFLFQKTSTIGTGLALAYSPVNEQLEEWDCVICSCARNNMLHRDEGRCLGWKNARHNSITNSMYIAHINRPKLYS